MTITAVDVFHARDGWANAPEAFILLLASLLETPAKAQEFCLFAERRGVVAKIVALAAERPDKDSLALFVAGIVCSEAYAAAKKDDYKNAEYIWSMALSFYPLHLPSKAGLAILYFNMADHGRALKYASEVIDAHENPADQPRVVRDLVSGEYEAEAAEATGIPQLEGSSKVLLDQMRIIRDAVR